MMMKPIELNEDDMRFAERRIVRYAVENHRR